MALLCTPNARFTTLTYTIIPRSCRVTHLSHRPLLESFLSETFLSKISTFVSRIFAIFHILLGFFYKYWKVKELDIFLFWRISRIYYSDRTPPYIDTYHQLFPIFNFLWKKRSPIRVNLTTINSDDVDSIFRTLWKFPSPL